MFNFNRHYQSELAYLREVGKAFSAANPTIAGFLSERGGDPDVARLLEGFAFLTARIRERIDDSVPEVVHGLTELLLPHYLRPVPACSVVEFTPQVRALRGRVAIPAGSELSSVPVDGTSCLFRTTAPVDLLPLTLLETTLDGSSAQSPKLRIRFQLVPQAKAEVLKGFRLFLHGDLPVTSTLFLWLSRHLRGVSLSAIRLPPNTVRPIGFHESPPLFPWPKGASGGFRVLQEFFTLPQKFLFLEVGELTAAQAHVGEQFELELEFDRPPPMPARLGKDILKLHCAPVINLFSADADPIRRDLLGLESMVRAAGIEPAHVEVYSVNSVTGLRSGQSGRVAYPPFFAYSHASSAAEAKSDQAYFQIRRELSPVNDGLDTYLSLGTPSHAPPVVSDETLSLELTCTNRSLPGQLQLGDLCVPTAASPTAAQFRNILPVSKPIRPPLGSELHWRLLSHLALNQKSLGSAESLRGLLQHYNFQALVDYPVGRANQLRIDAVRQVEMSAVRRLLDRSVLRGSQTRIHLEESHFAGVGDAFLFGAVLEELLAQSATLNSFNELSIRLHPSQMDYAWRPRSGTQQLL